MAIRSNKQILASRPAGEASTANFTLVEAPVAEPANGQVLVRNRFLSLDPYMRMRMNDASYAAPQALGEVMLGGTVGEVVGPRSIPPFQAGRTAAPAWAAGSITALVRRRPRAACCARSTRARFRSRPTSARWACRASPRGMARRHLRAETGADDRGQRRERRRRQRCRSAREGARLPRGRHRRRRRQVRLRHPASSASTPASTTRRSARPPRPCTRRWRKLHPTAWTAASRTSAAASSTPLVRR